MIKFGDKIKHASLTIRCAITDPTTATNKSSPKYDVFTGRFIGLSNSSSIQFPTVNTQPQQRLKHDV